MKTNAPNNQQTFSITLDSGANIIKFNDTSNLTGYLPQEILHKNWFQVFIPDSDMVEVLTVFEHVFKGSNNFWSYDNLITHKSGFELNVHFDNTIIFDDKGAREYISSECYITD